MRLLILLPAMLLPAASVAAPPVIAPAPQQPQATAEMPVVNPGRDTAANCPATSRYQAMQKDRRANAQRLNELPAADHYKAVYRRVGDCEVPIIAGYNIGGR